MGFENTVLRELAFEKSVQTFRVLFYFFGGHANVSFQRQPLYTFGFIGFVFISECLLEELK